jgi:hypothetical protein
MLGHRRQVPHGQSTTRRVSNTSRPCPRPCPLGGLDPAMNLCAKLCSRNDRQQRQVEMVAAPLNKKRGLELPLVLMKRDPKPHIEYHALCHSFRWICRAA